MSQQKKEDNSPIGTAFRNSDVDKHLFKLHCGDETWPIRRLFLHDVVVQSSCVLRREFPDAAWVLVPSCVASKTWLSPRAFRKCSCQSCGKMVGCPLAGD